MNKVKIKVLLLSIIITAFAFSQNHSNYPDHPESQNFKFPYSELNVFPSLNNNWVYYYTFRIPYNHLVFVKDVNGYKACLLYTSPSPRDRTRYRMPSSA